MRKRMICLIVALMIGGSLTCPALAASTFPDVDEDAQYARAAAYLSSAGIMVGDTQGNFNPDRNVTRAQMAAIICRMLRKTENLRTNGTRFSDVPTSYWANGYIVKAAELGVINGYADGTFKPDNTVTYEQAVAMVVRAMSLEELAITAGGYPNGHIQIAENYGFTNYIPVENNMPMERWKIALLIYNTQI